MLIAGYKNISQPFPQVKIITIDVNQEKKKAREPEELKTLNEEGWVDAHNFELLKNKEGIIFVGKKNNEDNMQIWHSSFPDGALKQVTTDTSDYAS